MKTSCYISSIEDVKDWHRSHYIIHSGDRYFAEFDTGKQLDFFLRATGISIGTVTNRRYTSTTPDGQLINLYQQSTLSIQYIDNKLFWVMDEIPENAKPIKALSNGSIVTCYYLNDGETLHFYRPNPNATRNIYDPLPLEQHINHVRTYGLY